MGGKKAKGSIFMIPKLIHYVWVGPKEKPPLVENCIESWKTHCPDYEIREWGNEDLEDIDNTYVLQAANEGMWAFVSDYMRLMALYNQGGVYCDTDLEITANIDSFLKYEFFTGFERALTGKRVRPVTALIASEPKCSIIESLLSEYNSLEFSKNGFLDLTTNTDRITSNFVKNYGVKKKDFRDGMHRLSIRKNAIIFPFHYFCTPIEGKENYSIHHFNGSWVREGKRKNIFIAGNYAIVKFTFNSKGPHSIPLRENEKIIFSLKKESEKTRYLALIKRAC